MSVTRRDVLERLGRDTDTGTAETVPIETLAGTFAVDERTIRTHVEGLVACELVRVDAEGSVGITVTGEELLALDTDGTVVVDTGSGEWSDSAE